MVYGKNDQRTLTKQVLIGLSTSCLLAFLTAHQPIMADTVTTPASTEQVDTATTEMPLEHLDSLTNTTVATDESVQTSDELTATSSDPSATITDETMEVSAPASAQENSTTTSQQPSVPMDNTSITNTVDTTAAAPLATSSTPAKIDLAPATVYMSEPLALEEVVQTTTFDPTMLRWELNGKPLSEWRVWSQDTGTFSGASFVQVITTKQSNDTYKLNIQFESLFGEDLSLRTPHNIRRTYRDYIADYQLTALTDDGTVVMSKTITLRPYESFRTHDEMIAEIEVTKQQAATDRHVTIETIGESGQGRPIKMGIIAKDQASIDHYLKETSPMMLTNPDEVLKRLIAGNLDYKLPVLINNTHADEQPGIDIITSAFNTFATKDIVSFDTVDADKKPLRIEYKVSDLLDRLILLFNFTESPDSDVLNMRFLPNGLDPNRDASYQVNPESRAVVTQMNKWNPISVLDLHGFVKPFMIEPATPPHDPNFEYDLLAKPMLEHAHEMGRAGITNSKYDSYEIPKLDYGQGWDDAFSGYTGVYALYHGILGHTLELPQSNQESFKAGYFAVLASLAFTHEQAELLMENRLKFYARGVNKVEAPEAEKELVNPDGSVKGRLKGQNPKFFPDYYVIPLENTKEYDVNQAFAMVEYFKRNGVIVQQLTQDVAGYKKGDLIIDMAQAKRGYANHILYPGSNESHWSEMYADLVVNFPALRGFVATPIFSAGLFDQKLSAVTTTQAPRTTVEESTQYYIVANNSIYAVQAVNEAIAAGGKVYLYEDSYIFSKAAFMKAQEKYALHGKKGPNGLVPVGQALTSPKIYVPYDYAGWVGYEFISDARRALKELGFAVVDRVEDADVVVLDTDRFEADLLGKKPTIVVGGRAMRQLERLGVVQGFDAERTGSSHEGLLKILLNDQDKLTSGYQANDLFYTNSGSWIQGIPNGFRTIAKIAMSDYYVAGWWPENEKIADKVVAIDGTYADQPLFIYAGNPMNRSHTHNFYRWISNAAFRFEYAEFKEDPQATVVLTGDHGVSIIGKVDDLNGAVRVVVTPVQIPVLQGQVYDGYDIKLVNAAGEVVQIKNPVTVSIAVPATQQKGQVTSVLYVLGDQTESLPFTLGLPNTVLFDVSHFSTYAVVYQAQKQMKQTEQQTQGKAIQLAATKPQTKATMLPNTGTQEMPVFAISTIFVTIGAGVLCFKRKEETANEHNGNIF